MQKTLYGAMIRIADAIIEAEPKLTELDSALGDGDCGIGLKTGFSSVKTALAGHEGDSAQELLKIVAKTLISSIGGTSGAIYGTAFMRMAAACKDRDMSSAASIPDVLTAGLEGAKMRGENTKPGDKTMIDAYEPAVAAFNAAVGAGKDLASACAAAAEAAHTGAAKTVDMVAKKGRASYLGERSIGHMDAGAYGITVIADAVKDYLI